MRLTAAAQMLEKSVGEARVGADRCGDLQEITRSTDQQFAELRAPCALAKLHGRVLSHRWPLK